MKQKRFTVEQIVAVLKQAEAGVPLAELLRRVGVSEQTFYRWKKQYVGLEVDQVRQLKLTCHKLLDLLLFDCSSRKIHVSIGLSARNSNQTTTHSIRISNLVPATTYYYEAQSTDPSGKTGNSPQQWFTSTASSTQTSN